MLSKDQQRALLYVAGRFMMVRIDRCGRTRATRHKPQGLKPGEGGPARPQARDYIMKSQMCQEKKETKFSVQRTVNMGYCVINQRKEIL